MVDTKQRPATANGNAAAQGRPRPEWQPQDRRDAIPVMGFREY